MPGLYQQQQQQQQQQQSRVGAVAKAVLQGSGTDRQHARDQHKASSN
jgi:hypothetical protein